MKECLMEAFEALNKLYEADEKKFVVIYKQNDSNWLILPSTKSGVAQGKAKELYSNLEKRNNIKAVKIIAYAGCFDRVAKANAGDKKALG